MSNPARLFLKKLGIAFIFAIRLFYWKTLFIFDKSDACRPHCSTKLNYCLMKKIYAIMGASC